MAHDFEKKWRSKDVLVLEKVDFSSLLLCDRVLAGLAKAGFKKPSPIQLEAIPNGRFGKDLLVQAKSGTGKTLVFVIVALEMLHTKIFRPQVLILVPTREIATQICSVIKSVGSYYPKLTCESFIGGFPVADDVKKAQKCQIVVGTPGRLKQLIEMKAISTKSIRLAVFDEADEVLSVSWLDDIDFIFNSLPEDKQVIATSATFPAKLKKIVIKYLRDPYLAQIDTRKLALLGITHYIKVVESSAMPIKQYRLKLAALESVLKSIKFTQCLVYCNGIHKVETLYRDIKKWGFSTTYISSNRDQAERLRAVDCLKRFKCKVLVSSNVTARGIDAENVDLVINFDVSNYTETYLHRSGRAGRYGTQGATISIVDLFELKYIKKIEKEANFKSYELPDPVPTDLIQKPVLDNYAIEVADDVEDSNEIAEELLSISMSGNNFEPNGNRSGNGIVAITDGNAGDSVELNGVSIPHNEGAEKSYKDNLSCDEELRNNLKNCAVNENSDDNGRIVDELGREKSENTSIEDVNAFNLGGQKIPKDSKSNICVSAIKNEITNALGDFKNVESLDTSNAKVKSNIIFNECCDKGNADSSTCKNSNLVGRGENSDIVNVKESTFVLNECKISDVVNIEDNGKNSVHINEKSSDMNVIETSMLSTGEEMEESFSKADGLNCHSINSDVKDFEKSLVSVNENFSHSNGEECSTLPTNEPRTQICVEEEISSNPQANQAQFVDKNEINNAVENYLQNYENRELTVSRNNKDSSEYKNSAAESISLGHIRDLNSRRCDYYYKVFKLFQKGHSSRHCEGIKEDLNQVQDSSVEKGSCFQKPSELNAVEEHSMTLTCDSEVTSENINELKFVNSSQVSKTLVEEVAGKEGKDNIPNFHKSPCYESTPDFEKTKLKITRLLDRGASQPPERKTMAFFDKVSSESASETESYHENTLSDPSSSLPSSDSESDSDSCTESSSSSRLSVSSSDNDDDDESCDEDSAETSSSISHSSVDSLSVHSIEYRCRKDIASFEKYPHRNAFEQEKASLEKYRQISHSGCSNKRRQKIHQHPNYSNVFFNHFPALGANYSNNAYEKSNPYRYSEIHQASSNCQHNQCKEGGKGHGNKDDFIQSSCDEGHSTACFVPSEHACHPYHDSTPCNRRAICDQWYRIFYYQWQHIQKCSNINF